MNLVGPGDVGMHYRDAELALGWLEPTGLWADLGSGAGFPGIVLSALFPRITVHLVESRRKRCTFLEHVLLAAGTPRDQAEVRCMRVEDLPGQAYDGIVARAFAPPPAVLDHARRLLVPGGIVVLFLQEGPPLGETPGFEAFHVEHYAVEGKSRRAVALRMLHSAC